MPSSSNSAKISISNQPFVSVIIPALNAEKTIKSCLNALFSLSYPKDKIEIILVDNGSSDRTVTIANSFAVKVYIKPDISISALRNYGASVAKGAIFAFTDSDCIVSKEWINNALPLLIDHNVAAVGCGYDIPGDATWVERRWFILKNLPTHEVRFLPGGNLIIKRDVQAQVGGFNESLTTGEDFDFCKRLRESGYKILSDSRVKVIHLGNFKTLYGLFKKEIWYGQGMLGTGRWDWINNPFIFANIYMISFIGLAIGIFSYLFFNKSSLFWISLLIILLIPIMAAFRRSMKAKNMKNFPFLIPIYFSYLMGRMFSLPFIFRSLFFPK